MNTTQTKALLLVAALLAAFILMFEFRDSGADPAAAEIPRLFRNLRPADVTAVEFTRTNLSLRAARSNGVWSLSAPIRYPAHAIPIEGLLDVCARIKPQALIPAAQVKSAAEFGLATPQAVFKFQAGGATHELRVGNRSPVGNQVYVQVSGDTGVAALDATLLEILPRSADDWRDRRLLSPGPGAFDRLRLRSGTRDLVFERDATNGLWRITSPPPAKRADTPLVTQLLRDLQEWAVQAFVTDDPKADLEPFGLATPQAELAFSRGTNDVLGVQFGLGPTNAPDLLFARRLAHTNIVLVPRPLLDKLRAPYWEWCDAHMVDSLAPTSFDTLEVTGPDGFLAQRQTNHSWRILSPTNLAADTEAIESLLARLASLEAISLAKEVVTDFKVFGLDPPQRRVALLRSTTNAAGTPANALVAAVDFGLNEMEGAARTDRVFARRHDENFVYTVRMQDLERTPLELWKVRDRQVWDFTTAQVARLEVTFQGRERKLQRVSAQQWKADGEALDPNISAAIEETAHRLGTLRVDSWFARGTQQLIARGFAAKAYKVNVILLVNGQERLQSLAFGPMTPKGPLAAVMLDGQPVLFIFPTTLYAGFIQRYLVVPE